MMRKDLFFVSTLTLLLFCFTANYQAQNKKIITPAEYFTFGSMQNVTVSQTGQWVAYKKVFLRDDDWLYLTNPAKSYRDSLAMIKDFKIANDESIVLVRKTLSFEEQRKLKKNKKKPDDWPKDTLWMITDDSLHWIRLTAVDDYQLPVYGSYYFTTLSKKKYVPTHEISDKPKNSGKKKKCFFHGKKMNEKVMPNKFVLKEFKKDEKLFELKLWQKSDNMATWNNVSEVCWSDDGLNLFFVRLAGDSIDSVYIHRWSPNSFQTETVWAGQGVVKKLTTDSTGQWLFFAFSNDTAKNKNFLPVILQWQQNFIDTLYFKNDVGEFKYVSINAGAKFLGQNRAILIYFTDKKVPDDTLSEDEKCGVQIWTWRDTILYTMEEVEHGKLKERRYMVLFSLKNNRNLPIYVGNELYHRFLMPYGPHAFIFIDENSEKYLHQLQWSYPYPKEVNVIDIDKWTLTPAGTFTYEYTIGPEGDKIAWYDAKERSWKMKNIITGQMLHQTVGIDFSDLDHDLPIEPLPAGHDRWSADGRGLLLYSHHDVYYFHQQGVDCITCHLQKQSAPAVYRVLHTKPRRYVFSFQDTMFFKKQDFNTKNEAVLMKLPGARMPDTLIECACSFLSVFQPEKNETLFLRKMRFDEYPDLWMSRDFQNFVKISSINPHIPEYKWGKVKLVHWKTFSGQNADGLLYFPEDLDTNNKYPMIVYFYEKNSQNLHRYYQPVPSASIINFTEYAGNDYVVFVPDIAYKTGDPGKSAYDYIVSGTLEMIRMHKWIDSAALGIQGQSWGGYQTAYLVTQTPLFKAAMAGAPVSNMTSAYGGIRWESGMSRMFQYENTQSRIGKTLWQDREAYIRNSPLFFADKVKTPLLIMANDKDGAVPWYQGIELFLALKRLGKPVWMLNYSGDKHNLTKLPNKIDLSIRMKQFFDYYLKKSPMPEWMLHGNSPFDQDFTDGLKLLNVLYPKND